MGALLASEREVVAGNPAMNAGPRLSVVVVSFSPPAVRAQCLTALSSQAAGGDVEILVVGHACDRDEKGASLQARFPHVKWLATPAHDTVPRRRSLGITQSRGEIVALLEDDCVVTEDWCSSVITAHSGPFVAIGGPIEPGDYRSGFDWAVFFCEYGRFMMPFTGHVPALPGNNVAYKRSVLMPLNADEGFYEVFTHEQWRQQGHTLLAEPKMAVRNIGSWSRQHTLRSAYHHGRAFGGMRVEGQPGWRRLSYAALAVCLPLLQVARVVRHVLSRKRHVPALLRALPWIGLFTVSWSWGEFLGYLLGAGRSTEEWR